MPGFGDDLTPEMAAENIVQKFFQGYRPELTVIEALDKAPIAIKAMNDGYAITAEVGIWVTAEELIALLKETE